MNNGDAIVDVWPPDVGIEPYYSDDRVVIFNADCRDVLMKLSAVDAVVTDPPYGIGAAREKPHNGWADYGISDWDLERPAREVFDAILSVSKSALVWGGNYFTDYLPPSMGWVGWDKGQRDFSLADFELAWTSEQRAARFVHYPRGKALLDGRVHPTQKPIHVMQFSIEYLRLAEEATILDPFAGSCTTAVAAKQLGRRCICIELEERYCEIGAQRCRQGVLW